MKYRKFTKQEKREINSQVLKESLHGSGLYLYQNSSNAELRLPRPTHSGLKSIGPNGKFQGDSYYLQLVKQGIVRLLEVIQTPEQVISEQGENMEEKLILDQPQMVTEHGEVEHVVNKTTPLQQLDETENEEKIPVLINESPDGFVIVD